ncbi:MAG: ABC transporter permease [Dehalococcoidia bacterium]
MTLLDEIWLHFDDSVRTTLRNPIWLVFGLFQPLLWLVLFAPLLVNLDGPQMFASVDALAILASGLMVLLALYGSVCVGFGLLPEVRAGGLDRPSVTPAHRTALVLGRTLRDLVVLLGLSILLLGIAWTIDLGASAASVHTALGVVLLIGMLLALCSYALALVLTNEDGLAATLNLVTLPLVLLSSVMLPLMLAPGSIRAAADLNPFFYAVDAVNALVDDETIVAAAGRGLVVAGALALLATGWTAHAIYRAAAQRRHEPPGREGHKRFLEQGR